MFLEKATLNTVRPNINISVEVFIVHNWAKVYAHKCHGCQEKIDSVKNYAICHVTRQNQYTHRRRGYKNEITR